jgi:hypothetical protein
MTTNSLEGKPVVMMKLITFDQGWDCDPELGFGLHAALMVRV